MDDKVLDRWRFVARLAAAALFVPFGLIHITAPEKLLPIMPPQIPDPIAIIILTGIAEILGGIGLLIPQTRKAAAVGLALYTVCVYPANIYHAFAHAHVPPLPDSWWYHGPRLLAQPLIVWWMVFAGGLVARRERATGG